METLCNNAKVKLELGPGQCISQGFSGLKNQQDV